MCFLFYYSFYFYHVLYIYIFIVYFNIKDFLRIINDADYDYIYELKKHPRRCVSACVRVCVRAQGCSEQGESAEDRWCVSKRQKECLRRQ